MGLRKGVYIGFWCPPENKKEMQKIAASQHRTLSQEMNRIVDEIVKARQSSLTTPARQGEERVGGR